MTVKKLAALLLTVALTLSLAACGDAGDNNSNDDEANNNGDNTVENQTLTIGDTFTNEDFEFTLTNIEFTNELYTFANENNTLIDDNFMMPLANGKTNPGGFKIRAPEDKILLAFTFSYEFIGETTVSDTLDVMGCPYVHYDVYTFSGTDYTDDITVEYAVFVKVEDDTETEWYILNNSSGLNVQSATKLLYLPPDYVPFENDNIVYEGRGYMVLPLEVYENESEPIEIAFQLAGSPTDRFVIR